MIFEFEQFLHLFDIKLMSFDQFCEKVSVLDIMSDTGKFDVRSDLDTFVKRVAKKDDRLKRLDLYKEKLYEILVKDYRKTLWTFFESNGALAEPLDFYFHMPPKKILKDKVFQGNILSKYGRICKNINFKSYYNTKKLYNNDSEYCFGLLKVMFEQYKIRNSLAGPAFFDHICNYDGDCKQFLMDFMMGSNRASIFNPITYKEILNELFKGDVLFAPVMGWNAYQLAFYNSGFKKFISTDVIPEVVENGEFLHKEYINMSNLFKINDKEVDLYLCPSEKLDDGFINKYRNKVDSIFFSPPYFDLEIYDSEEQSFFNYPNYEDWLKKYWEKTIELCKVVMKPRARLGFVISDYINKNKELVTISKDMKNIVSEHLNFMDNYRILWSSYTGSRQAKKNRGGNFEDLWMFENI